MKGLYERDAAALVGLNPYRSLMTVYLEKKGLLPERGGQAMEVGRALRDLIAALWSDETGKRCRKMRAAFADNECDFLCAQVERKVVGENAGLMCKVAGAFTDVDFDGGEIPPRYVCACQWQMMVCGFSRMYLAVLRLNGYKLSCFEIPRDGALIETLRRAACDFWRDHVLTDVPPAPDGTDDCGRAVDALCGAAREGIADLTQVKDALEGYETLGREIDALTRARSEAAQKIRLCMGGRGAGQGAGFTARLVAARRESVDGKRLKRVLPHLYDQFARVSEVRSLRVEKVDLPEVGRLSVGQVAPRPRTAHPEDETPRRHESKIQTPRRKEASHVD